VTATTKLALELLANSPGNQINANITFAQLNQRVMAGVVDKDLSTPPGSPADEALYIVASGNWGTGSSKAGQLAYWLDSTADWQFIVPIAGFRVSVLDELDASGVAKVYAYTGSAWALPESGGGGNPAGLPSRNVTASGAVTPTDAGKWLICNSATPITLTIGAEATAAWTISGILPMFHILQIGAGAVTVTGDGFSVTTHADDTNVLAGAGSAATALWRSSNVWSLIGRLVAA
jgi:hypothetical protein